MQVPNSAEPHTASTATRRLFFLILYITWVVHETVNTRQMGERWKGRIPRRRRGRDVRCDPHLARERCAHARHRPRHGTNPRRLQTPCAGKCRSWQRRSKSTQKLLFSSFSQFSGISDSPSPFSSSSGSGSGSRTFALLRRLIAAGTTRGAGRGEFTRVGSSRTVCAAQREKKSSLVSYAVLIDFVWVFQAVLSFQESFESFEVRRPDACWRYAHLAAAARACICCCSL
jgi:hypothetical protein